MFEFKGEMFGVFEIGRKDLEPESLWGRPGDANQRRIFLGEKKFEVRRVDAKFEWKEKENQCPYCLSTDVMKVKDKEICLDCGINISTEGQSAMA